MTSDVVTTHGVREYMHGICRCDDACRPAWRAYHQQKRRQRIRATQLNHGVAPIEQHNRNTYANWGCRCDDCVDAKNAYQGARAGRG